LREDTDDNRNSDDLGQLYDSHQGLCQVDSQNIPETEQTSRPTDKFKKSSFGEGNITTLSNSIYQTKEMKKPNPSEKSKN
jgi:hypothetical protein